MQIRKWGRKKLKVQGGKCEKARGKKQGRLKIDVEGNKWEDGYRARKKQAGRFALCPTHLKD